MIHVRSRRVEPQCCWPASQDPGPKCRLAAAPGLEELQGRRLQPQLGEEVPAAIQETETPHQSAQEALGR